MYLYFYIIFEINISRLTKIERKHNPSIWS